MERPSPELRSRIADLLGAAPSSFEAVSGGYTAAARWTFAARGTSYFIKIATSDHTRTQLSREIQTYRSLSGDFMPAFIVASDHEVEPLLILEDLSKWHWPPPWTAKQVDMTLAEIEQIHASSAQLPHYEQIHGQPQLGWHIVAKDKEPFLNLKLVTDAWLEHALPDLLSCESQCVTSGDAVTHFDIRSDNICIGSDGAKLIDWNYACLSNAKLDLGAWLPSLAAEGGPEPESILGDEPKIAAFISGFFAARAGLPDLSEAPQARLVQRQQLVPALKWVVRALDLPPPA